MYITSINRICAWISAASMLLLISIESSAQHQADKWFFGIHSGIDFSGGPVFSPGAIASEYGCSSMSDSSGNLLFYTDGNTVYNRNHLGMPNGAGLLGGQATQAAVIVPKPGSNTEYYIFTNDVCNGPDGLQYSIVDMSLDGGLGDVTAANFFVQDQLVEKLAVAPNRAGDGYWIAVHEYGGDMFYSYLLTANGLDPAIITSSTGISHNTSSPENGRGEMKFSPCGNRLAAAIGQQATVQVFDFDDSTGLISNPVTLSFDSTVHSVEFSPSGRYLYVSTKSFPCLLKQFDLLAGSETDVQNSATDIAQSPGTISLQLGPDGKIYEGKKLMNWLGIIEYPDSGGQSCQFSDSAVSLSLSYPGEVLPTFVSSIFRNNSCQPVTTGIELQGKKNVTVFPNPSGDIFIINVNGMSTVSVYDVQGKLLNRINSSGPVSFGKNYEAGIYFVEIISNKHKEMCKLVKQ